MGSWGYRPFDSDGAQDWLGPIERNIVDEIRRTLAAFLKQKVRPIPYEVLDETKKADYYSWLKKNGIGRRRRGLRSRPRRRLIHLMKWQEQRAQFFKTVKALGRSNGHDVAEAAAALLDELTPYVPRGWERWVPFKTGRRGKGCYGMRRVPKAKPHDPGAQQKWGSLPVHLQVNYQAERLGLYSLAAITMRELLADEQWVASWRDPVTKCRALQELLAKLDAKCVNEDAPHLPRSSRGRRLRRMHKRATWVRRMKREFKNGKKDLQEKFDWIKGHRPGMPKLILSESMKDAILKLIPRNERRGFKAERRPAGGWFVTREIARK